METDAQLTVKMVHQGHLTVYTCLDFDVPKVTSKNRAYALNKILSSALTKIESMMKNNERIVLIDPYYRVKPYTGNADFIYLDILIGLKIFIHNTRVKKGMNRIEFAEHLKISVRDLRKVLDIRHNTDIHLLQKVLWALKYKLRITLHQHIDLR